jgi:hypothetical protein
MRPQKTSCRLINAIRFADNPSPGSSLLRGFPSCEVIEWNLASFFGKVLSTPAETCPMAATPVRGPQHCQELRSLLSSLGYEVNFAP